MKKAVVIISFLFTATYSFTQTGLITLEDIWTNYKYYPASIDDLRSMKDGLHYTVNNAGTSVESFEYKSGNKVNDVFDVSMTNGTLQGFDNYSFSDDENLLLLATETESRYRWATFENNYVFDIATKKITPLSDKGKQMYADFSPVGNKIAYVINNNLYYKDLNTNTEYQLTSDGEKNKIINGGSDWVYEEEFTLVRSFEWSPNGNKIAYYRFDETLVPEFTLPFFADNLYPEMYTFKYPKVGEKNSTVEIFIYDITSGKLMKANTGDDEYIPRIKWIDNDHLCVTTINRLQNDLHLLSVNAGTSEVNEILHETAPDYLEIKDDLKFLPNNEGFIWSSERSRYNHLYHMDMTGKVITQITSGNWEVSEFNGYDESSKT